jgi:hypothetical protein
VSVTDRIERAGLCLLFITFLSYTSTDIFCSLCQEQRLFLSNGPTKLGSFCFVFLLKTETDKCSKNRGKINPRRWALLEYSIQADCGVPWSEFCTCTTLPRLYSSITSLSPATSYTMALCSCLSGKNAFGALSTSLTSH